MESTASQQEISDRAPADEWDVLEPTDSQLSRGRYRPITQLSSGGMANVELAVGIEAGNFKKPVVLKTIREELAFDPELVAMFLCEARLCARLNHSNLVQVYEVMEAPRPCIVMEYLEGIALNDIHRSLRLDFDTHLQLRILSDVLAGLHYAHELCDYDGTPLRIVHRDVSPQNVIITSEGRVKVLDFGIAKVANNPSFTQAGMVKGKMSYMSPEQLAGEPIDRRTDVFAVGCMLWRAAAGKKLWAKTSPEDIMRALVAGKIPSPSMHREVDPRLEAIVMRATAPDRRDRYESAAALRTAVDEFLAAVAFDWDLREWMQDTFAAHWVQQREKLHGLLSYATSMPPPVATLPPVATERELTELLTIAPPVSRAFRLATIGIVVVVVGMLLVGAIGVLGLIQPSTSVSAGNEQLDNTRAIVLRLRAEPASARISVDGVAAVGNPAVVQVRAGVEHLVEVALEGYGTLTRSLRFERETSLEFALVPKAPSAASAAPAPRRRGQVATANPTPSPRSAGSESLEASDPCEVPFYFKDDIKTYKPECL